MKLTARLALFASMVAAAAGVLMENGHRLGQKTKISRSFVRSLEFKYTLRICNAYPFPSALDAFMENGAKKLNADPMPYKTCGDFMPDIRSGDQVEFKVGDQTAGTFTISDLPNNDAVLLMVIYRHDSGTASVAFESHVFSNVGSAQVAILDLYKGRHRSELRVQSTKPPAKTEGAGIPAAAADSELLRFDSVVAIDPGAYDLVLRGSPDLETRHHTEFVALPREAYVAIRCGVDSHDGRDYPEDLIIFPHSDRTALGAGARLRPSGFMAMAALALTAMFAQQR